MGRSVDWLDIYRDHGAAAVRDALRSSLEGTPVHAGAARETQPGTGGAREDTPELILPEGGQAGPRAMVVLRALFAPQDRRGSAWELRRHGGRWYVYTRPGLGLPRWKPRDDEDVQANVRRELEKWWVKTWNNRTGEWDYKRFAPTMRTVDDILKAAIAVVGVQTETMPAWLPADFDGRGLEAHDELRWRRDHEENGMTTKGVIAFRNGLLDVAEWVAGRVRLLPHSPRWFSTGVLDSDLPAEVLALEDEVDLEEQVARLCPEWLRFVGELSEGSAAWVEALQRFVGYAMTPDISLDKALWVQGPPGSGKTTLVEGIEAAVGVENCVYTDLDTLSERFGVAPLVGKTLAIIPELHVGRRTNIEAALARWKAISGGAPQAVEDKFQRALSRVVITAKFVITPNEEPRLPDASAAIVRRLVALPVRSVPRTPDPGLGERLVAERAGVRAWALLGLRRLWQDVAQGRPAFAQPEEGEALLLDIEAASSPVKAFVRECCVVHAGSSVYSDWLFKVWESWRSGEGMQEWGRETFFKRLRAAVPHLDRKEDQRNGSRRRYIIGIRPRYESDVDGEEPRAMPLCDDPGYLDGAGSPQSPLYEKHDR